DLAAQNSHEHPDALPGRKKHLAASHHAAFCQRLKQRKLVIVQLRKRNTFGIAIKLFVLFFVGHLRPLRENLKRIPKINKASPGCEPHWPRLASSRHRLSDKRSASGKE